MRPVGSTLTRPRSGDPDGPAGMKWPSKARSTCSISDGGAGQPRHHLGGREPQHRRDVGVVGEPVGGVRIPAGGLQRRDQRRARGLGPVHRGPLVAAVLGQAERLPQARQGVLAAEQLAGPQDGQHQVEFGFPRGLLAEDVQARRGSGRP